MTEAGAAPEDLSGHVVGGTYRLVQRLGAGAMGTVYRAEGSGQQPCAVKLLNRESGGDEELRERFRREAEALFMVRHPNILAVHDFGVDAALGTSYLVMELLDGRSLDAMIDEHTPDPKTGVDLAVQICRGLAHAHQNGVLHRDLKTENVFITWDGKSWVAKLLDFGLVKLDDERFGPAQKLTMLGQVFGSPAYMSPEQATGAPLDARSDVYSMGVVLYELLTGRWPFEEDSHVAMARAHFLEAPPPLEVKRPGLVLRPELQAIVQRALAKKPADRFADGGELLRALEAVPAPAAWMSGLTHVPPAPIAPLPASGGARAAGAASSGKPAGASWRLPVAFGLGLAVLVALVATAWWLFH
jgi:serine/threonine-protein kinase